MPKKGQTQPYRVVFQHPGQKQHTNAHGSQWEAERNAITISRHGGDATVYFQAANGTRNQFAHYGPDVDHVFVVQDEDGWLCGCGREGAPDQQREHTANAQASKNENDEEW